MILYKVSKNKVYSYFDFTQKTYSSPRMLYKWIDDLNAKICCRFKTHIINAIPIIEDEIFKEKNLYGIAICSSEDTFDYEIGKSIAKNRLIEKYNSVYNRVITRIIDELYKVPHIQRLKSTLISKNNKIIALYCDIQKEVPIGDLFPVSDKDLYRMR